MAKRCDSVFDDVDSLLKEYTYIYNAYQALEKSDTPSNSPVYQANVTALIKQTESLVHGVNKHSLFGSNEYIDELPADHLRFILLPALLGYFTSKQTLVDPAKGDAGRYRKETVLKSQNYYKDYMRLCKQYGIQSPFIKEDTEDTAEEEERVKKSYEKDAVTRKSEKVLRYKAKKSLDTQLQDLISKLTLDHIDDPTKAEYYKKLIDQWILNAVEEMEFIEEELAILEHMSKMKSQGKPVEPPKPLNPPSRPFILTKSDLQKQVFGAGYPSVPTYTVEEFYEAQVRAGQLPPPGSVGPPSAAEEAEAAEQQEIVKEYNIENDDADTLQKAREWDDWKDDHRRGWGNRKNMG